LRNDLLIADRRRRYQESLALVRAALAGHCVLPSGGFFAFPRVSEQQRSALLRRGLGLVPGALFGSGYDSHARFCFTAEPLPRLAACCRILSEELSAQS
jgi:aspartate/methionine/tyrosine aminotransferase